MEFRVAMDTDFSALLWGKKSRYAEAGSSTLNVGGTIGGARVSDWVREKVSWEQLFLILRFLTVDTVRAVLPISAAVTCSPWWTTSCHQDASIWVDCGASFLKLLLVEYFATAMRQETKYSKMMRGVLLVHVCVYIYILKAATFWAATCDNFKC